MIPNLLLRPLAAIAFLMCLSAGVLSAERERLEAFLEVTGFDVALDSIALSATDAPAMLGMQAEDFGDQWRDAATEVFDTALMRSMALDILGQTLPDDVLTYAAGFYASPLGQLLVAAENDSHMIEDNEAKQAEGQALLARWAAEGDPRGEILAALNDAIDASDTAVRAVQEIQVRFLMAASASGVLDRPLDEAALRALMKEGEADLRKVLDEAGMAGAAYTYQGFSAAELETYLAALHEPQMQQVYELMNAVQYEIMANRFEALAARMAGMGRGQDL